MEWVHDITSIGSLPFYGIVMAIILFNSEIVLTLRLLICLVLLYAVASSIRFLFFKTRPEDKGKKTRQMNLFEKIDASSFPSIHSARTAVLSILLYTKIPTTLGLLISLGILSSVMVSRIILRKHYTIDVIGGSILGLLTGYVILILNFLI